MGSTVMSGLSALDDVTNGQAVGEQRNSGCSLRETRQAWSPAEDKRLAELVQKLSLTKSQIGQAGFEEISAKLGTGRSWTAVSQHWYLPTRIKHAHASTRVVLVGLQV